MKTFKFLKSSVAVVLIAIGISACDSGFQQLNNNPNSPTHAPAKLVIPDVEHDMAWELYNTNMNLYVGAIWVQYYAKIQYADEDLYNLTARLGMIDNNWDYTYVRIAKNLQNILDAAKKANDKNLIGVATILDVYNFQNSTDMWGDIPYSEALGGDADTPNIQPKFDSQKAIYTDLISRLKTAIANMDVGGTLPFSSQDLVYGGDVAKWQKFGNSLLLRLYMRMSKADPATAKAGVQSILNSNAPIFESNDDNAAFAFAANPYNNPVNDQARTRQDFMISTTALNMLEQYNDPRISVYAAPVVDKDARDSLVNATGYPYQGVRNGVKSQQIPLSAASPFGAYFNAPACPGWLMTYPEVMFIKAEAIQRGWISGDAAQAYDDAITASMHMYTQDRLDAVLGSFPGDAAYTKQGFSKADFPTGITDQQIQDYLSQTGVAYDPAKGLQQIATQKWLALFGQGFEGWTEWRRLRYPVLTPGPDAKLKQVPNRLFYPTLEESVNKKNLDAAMSSQGFSGLGGPTQRLLGKVWWEK